MAVTLVVEDGSSKTDANTYISLVDADTYFESRVDVSSWSGSTDGEKNISLAHACRVLDSYVDWLGFPSDDDQALAWPRSDVSYEKNGYEYFIDSDEIPAQVIDAQCELALILVSGDTQKTPDTAGFSSISIAGAISLVVDRSDRSGVLPDVVWGVVRHLGTRTGANVSLGRG
jgi:hypothetical protein